MPCLVLPSTRVQLSSQQNMQPVEQRCQSLSICSVRPKGVSQQPQPDGGRMTVQQPPRPPLRFSMPTPTLRPRADLSVQEVNRKRKSKSKEMKRYTIFFLVDLINRATELWMDMLHVTATMKYRLNWGKDLPLPINIEIQYTGMNQDILSLINELATKTKQIKDIPQRTSFTCNILYKLAEKVGITVELSSHSGRVSKNKDTESKMLLECRWKDYRFTKEDVLRKGKELYQKEIENHPELNL